ncbi:MAG TPA: aminotransferase class V-fold PLP-dependent enzyme [Thermomicrobiales bacterium]|nr:aminotransferase class V-fold PLP-dependent enzyme [Thermomicrobiales bacterium]HRA46544.1 aminotransferase class V-fold PLP-dependent enzyme [Thermomicrobiales bacterium]
MTSFYQRLEVPTLINAAGPLTRLGGCRLAPEVLAAMAEASASFVHIDQLQSAAGEVIAAITGAEAGYVTNGAAAGLMLATAACVAGLDVAAMDRLPDTTGLRNEIVVQRGHRNSYDHAIRAVGITFVEAGYLGYPGAGGTQPWQVEAAITERTAAIACPILNTPGTLPLPVVVEIAHRHGLPVIVDAAAELPPRSNLQRFINEGADLVVFSGGKSIGGPQSSGILAGCADLIASVALQHQDMDVRLQTWNRRDLVSSGAIAGIPHQGFGRMAKVGREEIAGLITALEIYAAGSDEADFARWSGYLDPIASALAGLPDISVARTDSTRTRKPLPLLTIDLGESYAFDAAYTVLNQLLQGAPAIALAESAAEDNRLIVNPHGLTDSEAMQIATALTTAIRNQPRST